MAFTTEVKGTLVKEEQKTQFVTGGKVWTKEQIKNTYHEQRLNQSKWAFWLSFFGGIVGFIIIIYTLIMNDNEWPGIVAGGIIDAVSVLFYQLSNRANEKVSEFFDKLTVDSNTTQAITLVEKINNPDTKDELIVKMTLHLIGINDEKICQKVRSVCQNKRDAELQE